MELRTVLFNIYRHFDTYDILEQPQANMSLNEMKRSELVIRVSGINGDLYEGIIVIGYVSVKPLPSFILIDRTAIILISCLDMLSTRPKHRKCFTINRSCT